jgi:hypothetical protein
MVPRANLYFWIGLGLLLSSWGTGLLVTNRMKAYMEEDRFWHWRPMSWFWFFTYWIIAPQKGWSRVPFVIFIAGFVLAMCFLVLAR